jgi:hypothetical protein
MASTLYEYNTQLELLKNERHELLSEHRNKISRVENHIQLKTGEVENLRFLSRCII